MTSSDTLNNSALAIKKQAAAAEIYTFVKMDILTHLIIFGPIFCIVSIRKFSQYISAIAKDLLLKPMHTIAQSYF